MTSATIEIYQLPDMDIAVEKIPVQYNPSEFHILYKGTVVDKLSISEGYNFQRPMPNINSEMTFKLTLDGYDDDEENAKDVSAYVSILTIALQVVEEDTTPTAYGCGFRWGEYLFKGSLTSLSARYTMFTSQGRPIRAIVDIKLQGGLSDQDKEQARRHRSEWRELANRSELYMKAYHETGSAENWREQARAQRLQNPRMT